MTLVLHPLYLAFSSALACALILMLLLRSGLAWKLALDQPNARSLHVVPTPRCGGWGIVPVVLIMSLPGVRTLWPLLTGALLLAGVSYLDDRSGLSARTRFVAHAVAVALALLNSKLHLPVWSLLALALLWIWAINLYNFMDGADGLAGCMALSGFATYAVASYLHTDSQYSTTAVHLAVTATASVTAGAALGFLFYNRPPARIFLGDVGSVPLGFLAAGLGILGWANALWPGWFPFMVFAPFLLDASVTLLKRLWRRERVWEAHREHYYQRMVRSGLSHARTTALWFACMLAGSLLALFLLSQEQQIQWAGVAFWFTILGGIGVLIDRRWTRFEQAAP